MIVGDVYAFQPGQMKRLWRQPYKNISGTLRQNPGDNQMAVAYEAHSHCNNSNLENDEDD